MKKCRLMRNGSLTLAASTLVLCTALLLLLAGAREASAQLTATDCLNCHTAIWAPGTASTVHHAKYPALNCVYCHNLTITVPVKNNCTLCHSSAGHQADHDKTALTSPECQECHVGNVYDEHYVKRKIACATCHASTNPDVLDAIAAGRGPTGKVQECSVCHANAGQHEADHDMTRANSATCLNPTSGCHYSDNVMTEHVVKRGWYCSACHGNPDPDISAAIAKGKGNLPDTPPAEVLCTDCHGLDVQSHESVHDHTFLPTVPGQDCTQCHVGNVVTEHVVNRQLACGICHASTRPEVQLAIEQGRSKEGLPSVDIYCISCHEQSKQGQGHALVTIEPWNQCKSCHIYITYNNDLSASHHDEHLAFAEDLNLSCAVCHVQSPDVPNCAGCHQLDTTTWGILPRGSTSLNMIGPNTEDHDKHTNANTPCNICHVTSVPGGTPIPPPYNECDSCHTDLGFNKPAHTTHMDAASMECNVCHTAAPDCGQCHAAGHPAVPAPYNGCDSCHTTLQPKQDTHIAHRTKANDNCAICHTAQPNCGQCHANGHPPVPTPYNECDNCHTSLPPGQPTHDKHRTEANQNCQLCHTAAPNCGQCHSAGHPAIPAPYNSCDQCHTTLQPKQATHIAHRTAAKDNCTTCHTAQPDCSSCHGNTHHTTTQAKSGDCTYCHADPRLDVDPNAPSGQLACRQCHVGSNGFVKTGSGKPSHAFNTAGAIKDYGACFDCHQPTPFHGKPKTTPLCWTLPTNSPYYVAGQAPGRGTFNIFNKEFRKPKEYYENTTYENRAEDWCEQYESSFTTPQISFSWVTFYDYFNTKQQWTVPTFGTGSTPPPNAGDTVDITQASYDREKRRITVYAVNSKGNTVTMKANYRGSSYTMTWNRDRSRWEVTISTSYCSSTVEVVSSAGGSDSSSISNCSSYSR